MNTFGDRLVALREKLGKMSQTAFAESLGTSRGVIVNLEKGITVPKPQFLNLIVAKHNVNIVWLETGDGEMFKKKTAYETLAEFFGDVLNDEPESFRIAFLSSLAELDDDGWAMLAEECRIKAEIYNKMKKDSE